MAKTWNSLRASWVNGERTFVGTELKRMHKKEVIKIVFDAVIQSQDLKHKSEDLKDLLEILAHYRLYFQGGD